MHSVLAIVDIASDFCCLKYVDEGSRPTASGARLAFEEAWLSWAGPPSYGILLDLDTAYLNVFEELLNDLGIPAIPAAPEAHWQMGKIEAKIRYVKEMATVVFSELDIRTAFGVRIAVGRIAAACNALVSNAGFSPNQWVLGSGIRMPADLANT